MGVVYRARDERLERDVALKVLPPNRLADDSARRRFRKEALALSRLSHPNIAVVHDFDSQDGLDFLIMEYVPGTTLADLVPPDGLPEREVLRLGAQLADGLAAAHSERVLHRDLKPGNLRLTPDGRLKILDFGLARLFRHPSETATTETVADAASAVGTLPYVAPEQFEGGRADERADIYSAGAVLYEMATGRRAAVGADAPRLIHAILREPPVPPRQLNPRLSPGLEGVLLKALDKDPLRRYQSARELRVDLERLSAPMSEGIGAGRRIRVRWRALSLAAIGTATVAVLVSLLLRSGETMNPVMIPLLPGLSEESESRLSPDGRWVSYTARRSRRSSILVRPSTGGEPQTAVTRDGNITSHVWSPRGDAIAFLSLSHGAVMVQVVPAMGGPPARSLRLEAAFAAARLVRWFGPRLYLSVDERGLWRLDLETGRLEHLFSAQAPSGERMGFDVCADERRVVYYEVRRGLQGRVWTAGLRGEAPAAITRDEDDARRPRWMGPGCHQLVFTLNREGQVDLWRAPAAGGAATRITVSANAEYLEDSAWSTSALTFRVGLESSHLWHLDPGARIPRARQITAETLQDSFPSASMSTPLLSFQRSKPAPEGFPALFDAGIHLARLEALALQDLRVAASSGGNPSLSPRGVWLAYIRNGQWVGSDLWLHEVASGHSWRVSDRSSRPLNYMMPLDWVHSTLAWSHDGESLFFVTAGDPEGSQLHRLVMRVGGSDAEILASGKGPVALSDPHASPDGRWLGYVRSAGGERIKSEVHALDLRSGEDRVLLTYDHDVEEAVLFRGWLADGRSLLVFRTRVNPDWTDRIEIDMVDVAARRQALRAVDQAFGGTARLDARAGTLYLTKADEETGAHNLWAIRLAEGSLRRLTDNSHPGVSYAGITLLADGTLLYARQEKKCDVWLLRFEH